MCAVLLRINKPPAGLFHILAQKLGLLSFNVLNSKSLILKIALWVVVCSCCQQTLPSHPSLTLINLLYFYKKKFALWSISKTLSFLTNYETAF